MKTLSRSAAVWIAIGCVVLGAPSAGSTGGRHVMDPPAPATAPTPGGDAWDGDSVDLSTGIFVHRKTDLYLDAAIPIALTRTYRSGDRGVRPFGIGSSHPYQIFLSATAPYQEASLIQADGSAIRYVRTTPGTDVLGAVFEHVGTPTAFYGSTLTGAGFWTLATADGTVYELGANAPLQRIDDQYNRLVQVFRHGAAVGPETGVVTQVISPNNRWIIFAVRRAGPDRPDAGHPRPRHRLQLRRGRPPGLGDRRRGRHHALHV